MLATDCCLLISFFFLLCPFFFFGNFGMDINDLSAFVLATNLANRMLRLWTAALFAQSQRRGRECMMAPGVARLAPVMSHSNYHGSNIAYFVNAVKFWQNDFL